jgi:hypothetical protein
MGDEVGYVPPISKKALAWLSGLPFRRGASWRQFGLSAAFRHRELGEQNFLENRPCNDPGYERECSDNQAYPDIKAQNISQCHRPVSRLLRWRKA